MKSFRAFLSQQLGFPSGWFGRLLLQLLNRSNASMNDLVLQELKLQSSGDRVLEIGFGGGDLIHKIMQTGRTSLIAGIERSPDALKISQKRFYSSILQGNLELYLADAAALPFPEHHFSQVCTVNTLYFWSDASQVLAECHRVLSPGGKLILCYTSKAYLEQQKFSQHGFMTYEVSQVEMMLKSAGVSNIRTISDKSDRHQEFFCTSGIVGSKGKE